MFKHIGFWIYDMYRFFFDIKVNPLRHIPDVTTQFVIMFYLSVMWTAVFTVLAGSSIYWGLGSVAGHLLVVGAFFITVSIFHDAEKNGHLWVKRSVPRKNANKNICVWDLENEG